jgi:predicted transposase YdaD
MSLLPKGIELLPPYDERERAIFRNRRIAMADQESNRITAVRNERLTIARNALKKKMSVDDIVDLTGLTRAEVERLRDAD